MPHSVVAQKVKFLPSPVIPPELTESTCVNYWGIQRGTMAPRTNGNFCDLPSIALTSLVV